MLYRDGIEADHWQSVPTQLTLSIADTERR